MSSHILFRRLAALALGLLGLGAVAAPARAQSSLDPVCVFHTTLGDIKVQLYPDIAPQTVANFLHYVNFGAYTQSLIHRSVHQFIFQGGGYQVQSGTGITAIPTAPPVVNEFHISNTRGTIAMAKLGGDPNSATSEWFFNEADNSANLDNQNGGFTVFGKVLDNASLAVMDQIAAVPVPSPSPVDPNDPNSPFSQIPLVNYTSGSPVQQSNLVLVSSITPPATATHLLWTSTDGTAAIWTLDSAGNVTSTPALGPISGWTAKSIADGSDGQTRLLWTKADGTNAVWTVNTANNAITSTPGYGPIAGWNTVALSVGADNLTRLQWKRASDGESAVWTLDSAGNVTSTPAYGPSGPWTAGALAVGEDSFSRLLWSNASGQFSVWTLGGSITSTSAFNPSGFTAIAIAGGLDLNTRLLLNRTDGAMAVWTVDVPGNVTSTPLYGPISGWTCHTLAVGPDALTRVLWNRSDGAAAVWTINADGSIASTPLYGPITGWSATAVSVGP